MPVPTHYTSDELLEIFREQHRLCSPLDVMADETFVLQRTTEVWEYQDARDLLPWDEYGAYLNLEFGLEVSRKTWKAVLTPVTERTLGDLCDFLSTVAVRQPLELTGAAAGTCMSATIFRSLKTRLKRRGVDVANLRPSSEIGAFLEIEHNFSPLIEFVTMTGVQVFDRLTYGPPRRERRYSSWFDRLIPKWLAVRPLDTGKVKTFRDLVLRIMDNQKLGKPPVFL